MPAVTPQRQRFSHSRLTALADCPRRYRYRYVEGLKESFRSVEAFTGTLVHSVVGWLYEEREQRRSPSADELVERFRGEWDAELGPDVQVVRPGRTLEQYRGEAEAMLRLHHETAYREDRLETLEIEPRVDVEIGGRGYVGYVDRLARSRETGCLRIVDFKTGRRVPADMRAAGLQVHGYGLAVLERHGGHEIELEYLYLRRNRSLRETMPRAETHDVAARLGALIDAAEKAEEEGHFPARPSALCGWCGFRDWCDASQWRASPAGASTEGGQRGCPRCGRTLRLREGRNGAFVGCTGFPTCRFSRDAHPEELS